MPTAVRTVLQTDLPFRVRRSKIHGTGVFATRAIPKGARLLEYVGERVSHAEADRRYEDKAVDDNHTFLFTVDSRTVIDAGVDGNDARFLNHSCDPNCETVIEQKRVYIESVRAIAPGEELAYDYMISREPGDPPDIEQIFACRCGAANCRGTMLLPPKPLRKRRAGKAGAKAKAGAKGKAKGKAKVKAKAKSGSKAAPARAGSRPRGRGAARR